MSALRGRQRASMVLCGSKAGINVYYHPQEISDANTQSAICHRTATKRKKPEQRAIIVSAPASDGRKSPRPVNGAAAELHAKKKKRKNTKQSRSSTWLPCGEHANVYEIVATYYTGHWDSSSRSPYVTASCRIFSSNSSAVSKTIPYVVHPTPQRRQSRQVRIGCVVGIFQGLLQVVPKRVMWTIAQPVRLAYRSLMPSTAMLLFARSAGGSSPLSVMWTLLRRFLDLHKTLWPSETLLTG